MEDRLLKSREAMYRFLSRLYLLEVDEPLLFALKNMEFPKESPDEDMSEGYRLMEEYLSAVPEAGQDAEAEQEALDDLAVDYARVFLSAGVAQGQAAFPYESVYTSKGHLMMQESRSDFVALYEARGLRPVKDMYRVPEDHLGLLLEYMAILCSEASTEEQADFLEQHLSGWVPVFAQETIKYAGTGFYQGLAKLTRGFLKLEQSLLAG